MEPDGINPRCPVTPENIKEVKPLSSKDSKTKEERLLEMFIKAYITDTEYYKMLERIKKEKI